MPRTRSPLIALACSVKVSRLLRPVARYLVSDTVSGLLLSQPVPIMGTVGRYPTVYLIGRSHILWRRNVSRSCHSRR